MGSARLKNLGVTLPLQLSTQSSHLCPSESDRVALVPMSLIVLRLYSYLQSGAEATELHHKNSVSRSLQDLDKPALTAFCISSNPHHQRNTSVRRSLVGMRHHASWMISVLSFLVLSTLSARLACHATPSSPPRDDTLIKHKWDAIPDNWVSLGQPPNGTTIKLHIALKANRENALIDALHEVSHPRHPKHVLSTSTAQLDTCSRVRFRYGMHLSREQVAELVAPHPDALELVFSWLKCNGVPPSSISMTNGGSWLTVAEVPLSKANELLGASYELYNHDWTNETILRTVGYALPAGLHPHVKTVVPTTAFTSMRPLQQTLRSHSNGEAAPTNRSSEEPWDVPSRRNIDYVEPSFLRWLYKMPFNDPAAPNQNKLGIAGFVNEVPNQMDLFTFMARFRSDANSRIAATQVVTIVPVNGGMGWWGQPGMRANFDTQYSVALTYPTQVAYYTIGGDKRIDLNGAPKAGDHFLEWLMYMTGMEKVPQTISVPYFIKETWLSAAYVEKLCELFGILGLRGASVLAPSGDYGVGRGTCKDVRGNVRFYTVFPASCTCYI